MKNIAALLILSISIVSCGGGGDDPAPTPTPVENKAPSVPTLLFPTNGLLCVDNAVTFAWNESKDPEENIITYEIIIAKDSQFTNIVKTDKTQSLTKSYTLEKGVAHYWKVKAEDAKSKASDYSPQWGFYTEGVGTLYNYVPFAATLIKPTINSTVSGASVVFEWNASDLDATDTLKYDFYLSTSATMPSQPTEGNHDAKTITRSGLQSNTTYFWRIDVKDYDSKGAKGGKSTGQIWSFKTS